MLTGFDRAGFGPAEQFIGGDGAFTQLQVLLRVVGHPLGKLVRMRQEKVNVESARLIEHLCGGIQGRAFLGIGSPLPAFAQVKEQFRRAGRLSHLFPHVTAGGSVWAPALIRLHRPVVQCS
jgi:hypothetical protein